MVPLVFRAACLKTFTNAMLNSKQANLSACRTPFFMLIGSDNLFCIVTQLYFTKAISFWVYSTLPQL